MSRDGSEIRDGMRIEWDVPIETDDGTVLRGDVFRPTDDGSSPVVMSHGPYGKGLHFEDSDGDKWDRLVGRHPEVATGTSNRYQAWEVADPERWVPDGYAVVRVDSRGSGRSPGYVDVWSHRQTRDLAQCIEWAGERSWSNGKVGLLGISYYAMNQWQVATLQPDHLAAICVWEGASDWYREVAHHGGIYSTLMEMVYDGRVVPAQHGAREEGYRSRTTGEWVTGPERSTNEELGANRADVGEDMRSRKLATDDYWTSRTPDWSEIEVPLLSAANWGHHGLHTRGNFEGFLRAGTDRKWLEVHGREHWTEFYTDYGVSLQKDFFGHFLKGEDTGWTDQPRVLLNVRRADGGFVRRHEDEWPLARTDWTEYYLHADGRELSPREQERTASVTYDPLGDGVTFLTDPLDEETEVTGPAAAKLFVSAETEDADLFLVLRAFRADMEEVVFQGAADPNVPVALGWLRASHRKLDPEQSTDWRPYHTHDEVEPLTPGEVYELDVEIWPTSVVLPAGSRLALSVRGRDYEYPPDKGTVGRPTGVGGSRHDDADDRPPEVYGGDVTVHTGPDHPAHVLLPVVPDRE